MSMYARLLNNLPVNPSIAAKILSMAGKQDFSFSALEEVIMRDPGLTAKILKIANSALYARQNKVTRLQAAITLLGINTIKNLVILVTGSSLFAKNWNSPFYTNFWRQSLATAFLARDLALKTNIQAYAEEAFVAGLLHNVGQVALFLHDPAAYEILLERSFHEDLRISRLERDSYGTDHKEVGNEVLSGWNFPEVFSHAALEHGNANVTSTHKQVVILVTIADFIASNWFFLADTPKPLSLVGSQLEYLGTDEATIGVWETDLRGRLEADPFYRECQNLIKG
jgi:HD-like signal output (HDOD) protein